MISTVFRLCAEDFDVLKFLKESKWDVIRYWIKGEKDQYRNTINKNSGFNLSIAESKEFSKELLGDHIQAIIKFINKNKKYLSKLNGLNISVDIGVINNESFSFSTTFKGEILELFVNYNIELSVSFYPGE